jgi:hypothetical protein
MLKKTRVFWISDVAAERISGGCLRCARKAISRGSNYSEQSVAVSRKKNRANLGERCHIRQGTVSRLPYGDSVFDVVTAFETVYFGRISQAIFRRCAVY